MQFPQAIPSPSEPHFPTLGFVHMLPDQFADAFKLDDVGPTPMVFAMIGVLVPFLLEKSALLHCVTGPLILVLIPFFPRVFSVISPCCLLFSAYLLRLSLFVYRTPPNARAYLIVLSLYLTLNLARFFNENRRSEHP